MDQLSQRVGVGLGLLVLFVIGRGIFRRASSRERSAPSNLQKMLYAAFLLAWVLWIVSVFLIGV
jgi:hypothetical protein